MVANLVINYMCFTDKKDACDEICGTRIQQVYSMNPEGSLPNMVVDKLIAKQQDGLLMIADMLRKAQ